MRVIAGSAKSIRLAYPRGAQIRPTTDAVRESLFSSLGGQVQGARFADLYAGAGSVGIEALSRGAELAVFIERDPACVQALIGNLENTRLSARAHVLKGDVAARWNSAWQRWGPFDIVFADPPYGLEQLVPVLERLVAHGEGVAAGGLVVVQHTAAQELGPGLTPQRQKRFGETLLSYFAVAEGRKTDADE